MKLLKVLEQRALNKEASVATLGKASKDILKSAVANLLKFVKGLPKGQVYGYEIEPSKVKTALNATKAWMWNHPKTTIGIGGATTAGAGIGIAKAVSGDDDEDTEK